MTQSGREQLSRVFPSPLSASDLHMVPPWFRAALTGRPWEVTPISMQPGN